MVVTDFLANSWSYNSIFINEFLAPLIIISRISKFLRVLNLIESYDDRFQSKFQATKIISRWVIYSIFSSILNVACIMAITIYKGVHLVIKYNKTIFLFYGFNIELTMFYLFVFTASTILEYGSFFVLLQIFYLSKVLISRLSEIIAEVEVKTITEMQVLKPMSKPNRVFGVKGHVHLNRSELELPSKSWKVLGLRYLELERIFNAFGEFCGIYFILLLAFLIISIVCTIYGATHMDPSGPNQEFRLCVTFSIIFISIFRIHALTNVGQTFQDEYVKLVKAGMTYGQEISNSGRDRDEVSPVFI